MTKSELKKQSRDVLNNVAYCFGMTVCRDMTKRDLFEMIADRLGDDTEAWTLMDQYRDEPGWRR